MTLDSVAQLAREIGLMLMDMRATRTVGGTWSGAQFKSDADVVAHHAWLHGLKRLDPDTPVVSEEDADSQTERRPSRYWLVDPVDGTASYAGGFAGFVTQAALVRQSAVILAAIFAPAFDELYTAQRGAGAWLNGSRLTRAVPDRLTSLIDNYPEPRGVALQAYRHLGLTRYIECGSISLKILRVAEGSADLFIKDVEVRDWDIAAPKLVMEEAGGSIVTVRGERYPLQGGYEHAGIIAAPSPTWSQRVALWYAALDSGSKQS